METDTKQFDDPTKSPVDVEPPASRGAQHKDEEGTLLSSLREKRNKIGSERHLELEIPGYDGELVVRYQPIPWEEAKRITERLENSKNPRKELYAQADVLIRACEEILARVEGKLVPLSTVFPEVGAEPIGFDARLAKALGFDVVNGSEGRSAVLGAFNNDLAVSKQQADVMEWIQNSERGSDQDF